MTMTMIARQDHRTAVVVDYGLKLAAQGSTWKGREYMRQGNVPKDVISRVLETCERRELQK